MYWTVNYIVPEACHTLTFNVSLFMAMLEWLDNCTIEDSSFSSFLKHTVSVHVNVVRHNYSIIDL